MLFPKIHTFQSSLFVWRRFLVVGNNSGARIKKQQKETPTQPLPHAGLHHSKRKNKQFSICNVKFKKWIERKFQKGRPQKYDHVCKQQYRANLSDSAVWKVKGEKNEWFFSEQWRHYTGGNLFCDIFLHLQVNSVRLLSCSHVLDLLLLYGSHVLWLMVVCARSATVDRSPISGAPFQC